MQNTNKDTIRRYYSTLESRWGYRFLLKGTKHYGYYPKGIRDGLSLARAQRLMEKEIGKNLGLPKGSKVLDAGCGEGHVAIHITQDFEYHVYGIDLLDVSVAEKNRDKLGLREPTFTLMDYSQTDFPDNFFDGIYTIETLVHSPDYKLTLKEFYRILKPGGVLVNHEYALVDTMSKDEEKTWEVIYKGGAMMGVFKDFRVSKMRKIWEKAGFVQVTVRDATREMIPNMKIFYELAYIPFHIFKLFRKEKNYINIYAAVKSYKLRHLFQYTVIKAYKPKA